MKETLSRRSFVAGGAGALAMGAFALAGCSASDNGDLASTGSSNIEWDEETDVVVMGFGGAGASAAIGASEAGANVIIFEKAPEGEEGGNTSTSGGGSSYTLAEHPDYLKLQFPDTIDQEEIDGLIEELKSLPEWFEGYGETVGKTMGYPATNGFGLFTWLKGIAENSPGVSIRYDSPVKRLIFDPDTKEVFGVVVENGGEEINVKAKRGVVMACGGFENNHDMLTAYYPPQVPIFPAGTPYNTGDGIPMVAALGARMRGFSSVEWGCHCCKLGSEEMGVALAFSFQNPDSYDGAIVVNSKGKRFVSETNAGRYGEGKIARPIHAKEQLPELALSPTPFLDDEGNPVNVTFTYDNLPMYLIFGESRMNNGEALFTAASKAAGNHWASLRGVYTWSDDNQAELQKGWIVKGDTLEELAQKMNIDPEGLVETVAAYEQACVDGVDKEFGRTYTLTSLGDGPFYACELAMSLINTQGGPARDGAHRVLNYNNEPIPRLYAGGEFGSIFVFNYPGALNVPEAMGTRVAGANAAAETPWDE